MISDEGLQDYNRQLAPYRAGGVGLMLAGAGLVGTGAFIAF